MSQRNHLSFDLTREQWASVNQAMLACFARRTTPDPCDPIHDDPVNEALAIICRQWLAVGDRHGHAQKPTSDFRPPTSDFTT